VPLRLLLDEDAKSRDLLRALRDAGHDVETTASLGLDGFPDSQVLATAHRGHRILISFNYADFLELDRTVQHSGILLAFGRHRMSPDAMTALIVNAIRNVDAAGVNLSNTVHQLNSWAY
jgi:predicted nuclease of predicted toxin-antitoxin system